MMAALKINQTNYKKHPAITRPCVDMRFWAKTNYKAMNIAMPGGFCYFMAASARSSVDRTLPSGGKGQRFESSRARHSSDKDTPYGTVIY